MNIEQAGERYRVEKADAIAKTQAVMALREQLSEAVQAQVNAVAKANEAEATLLAVADGTAVFVK